MGAPTSDNSDFYLFVFLIVQNEKFYSKQEKNMTDNKEKTMSNSNELDVLVVIGTFLGVFGMSVIVAIFFTHNFQGKITNLICGSLLIFISAVVFVKSKFVKQKK